MKLTLRIVTYFILVSFLYYGCAKDKGPWKKAVKPPVKSAPISPFDTITVPTVYTYSISFSGNIKPIFQASCIMACHNPMHPKLDLRPSVAYNELLTLGASAPYVNVVTPNQSNLYLHLVGIFQLMPNGGPKLAQGKIDTIYTWISQGALNN